VSGYAASGPLTPRQRQVLAAAARGATAAETGRELYLAEATVRAIRHSACVRLGAPNLTAAVYLYARLA
jgi:two-component system, NarL family, response regulator DesR